MMRTNVNILFFFKLMCWESLKVVELMTTVGTLSPEQNDLRCYL